MLNFGDPSVREERQAINAGRACPQRSTNRREKENKKIKTSQASSPSVQQPASLEKQLDPRFLGRVGQATVDLHTLVSSFDGGKGRGEKTSAEEGRGLVWCVDTGRGRMGEVSASFYRQTLPLFSCGYCIVDWR